jgi:hypothetical protein
MNRLLAANIFLLGLLIGVSTTNACNIPGARAADGECSCVIEGPIEVSIDASPNEPVPVMICDGQEDRGICAEVYESGGGSYYVHAN